jgi:predicted secreted protein
MKRLALALPVLALVSCSYHALDKEAPAVNTVKVSEKFVINLPEDHTKGYTWSLSNDYDTQVAGYIKAVWHGNEKGVDFNFQADAPGKTELVFYSINYRDTAAVKHFIVEAK